MLPLLLALQAPVIGAFPDAKPPIITGAREMEEPGRYRARRPFDDTVEWYKRTFKTLGGVRWRNIVNTPSVRAVHLECVRSRCKWAGINIYETRGEVRLFVVPKDPPKKKGS